jgi:hypothetical protein
MISGMLEDHGIERSAERIGLIVEMITGGKRHVLQVGKTGILRCAVEFVRGVPHKAEL